MTIQTIKEKIKGLEKLPLNFGYEKSGDTTEINRVARLIMDHFGLSDKISVRKSMRFPGYVYDFCLNGESITEYRVYDTEGKMGHANATMCINDLVAEALCRKDIKNAPMIAELFDPWTSKIRFNY